jgi:TGS domain
MSLLGKDWAAPIIYDVLPSETPSRSEDRGRIDDPKNQHDASRCADHHKRHYYPHASQLISVHVRTLRSAIDRSSHCARLTVFLSFIIIIMGSNKKGSLGSGGSKDDFHVFATRKWAVLDAPGVAQPDWNNKAEALKEEAGAADSSAAQKGSVSNKEGLQGRRATKSSGGPKIAADGDKGIGGDSFVERQPNPAWLQHRVQVYDEIAALRQSELAHKQPAPITVALPDGKVLASDPKTNEPFAAWKTTPYDVAASISSGLADASTVAKVTYQSFVSDYKLDEDGMVGADTLMSLVNDDPDGNDDNNNDNTTSGEAKGQTFLWDMTRPLVGNVSKIEFLKFEESQDAKTVFWHSSAHMMGEALERLYGCKLTIGPPLAGGFYYDSYMNAETLKEDDCTWRGSSRFGFHFDAHRSRIWLFAQLQTPPSKPKSARSSSRSKSSSAWSSPRRRDCGCLPTTPSRSGSCRPRSPRAAAPPSTGAAISLTCAAGRTCRTPEKSRRLPPPATPPPTGSATRPTTASSACTESASPTRRCSRCGRRTRRR